MRLARSTALFGEEYEGAQPFEGPEAERELNGPRRPGAPHEKERDDGKSHGDHREIARAQKVRAEDEEDEGDGKETERGHRPRPLRGAMDRDLDFRRVREGVCLDVEKLLEPSQRRLFAGVGDREV